MNFVNGSVGGELKRFELNGGVILEHMAGGCERSIFLLRAAGEMIHSCSNRFKDELNLIC